MTSIVEETITIPLTARPLYAVCRVVERETPISLCRSLTKPRIVENDSYLKTPPNKRIVIESSRRTRTMVKKQTDDYLIDLLTTENKQMRELITREHDLLEILNLLESMEDSDELSIMHVLQEYHIELLRLKLRLLDELRSEEGNSAE